MFKKFLEKETKKEEKSGGSISLAEMLTVAVIISILTAVVAFSSSSFKQSLSLQQTAIKMAQDIRQMKIMAISSSSDLDCVGSGVKKYGYGISIDGRNNKYILFADCDNNNSYNPLRDKKKDDVSLRVYTMRIETSPRSPSNPSTISILFEPPNPTVEIGPNKNTNSVTITIEDSKGNKKEIFVNKAGLIYVK
ncbi:MAG TPA: hypothetical protein ENL27_00510 [Candidatus Parcubacteria bacterium]|nr:hypothetical protein [Candidatus Parcubacteria bacterium]